MRCHRCRGLMTVDSYVDRGGSCDPLWLRVLRCMNCGEVTEPGIVMNRPAHRNWLRRVVKRSNDTRLRRDEQMPLKV